MAGVEAVIGGAFVSAIIKEVVKTGRSYFADKYKEHKGTQKMLDSLEASLPRLLYAIRLSEQKSTVQDTTLREWLRQLKDVAYEAKDIMDDFEAKRISSENKGKVSKIATSYGRAFISLLWSDKDEKKLKDLIEKIKNICDGIGDFTKMIEPGNNNASDGRNNSSRETSSFLPKTKKIFGREEEIKLILDIIFYTDIQSYVTYPGPESGHDDHYPVIEESISHSQDTQESHAIEREELGHESSSSSDPSLGKKEDLWILWMRHYVSQQSYVDNSFSVGEVDNSFSVGERLTSVLPIVGIGGVGKTTIAQVIYNHPKVKAHFDLRGWVYVVDSTDHTRIVQDTIRSFNAGTNNITPTINSLDDGHCMLKNAITEKKFLIIFDDVREGRAGIHSTWKKLLELLAEGSAGSIVMVTTETKSVAEVLGTLPPIHLDLLDVGEFLALFEYHAFAYSNNQTRKHQDEETVLKPIGQEIAGKLGGLPLAAEVVGTLLSTNPNKNYWEMILKSDWWDHEHISGKILLSLGASFQDLDPNLKQCFMFCSLFPKNYVFDKDKLVQMWMAHGLIHPTEAEKIKLGTNKIQIEEIGREKFDKLVDKFFFQTTVLENKYVMHDLIREVAIANSSEVLYVNGNHLTDNKTIPSYIRHLALDPNMNDDVYVDHVLLSEKNKQNLRTIMFFGFCKMSKGKCLKDILDKLGGLRLLDLSYFRNVEVFLPDPVIGQLSHLRFLDLSFSGVGSVPNSLCELVHLQVLDMRGCKFSKLPDRINRLINLRHLYANPHTLSLIRGIGRLTNLQELEKFHVRKEKGFSISELKDMNSLTGKLAIEFLEEMPSEEVAYSAKLESKRFLTTLLLSFSKRFESSMQRNHLGAKHIEILEALKPHKDIRELRIEHFMCVTLPSWVMKTHRIENLRSIQLVQCYQLITLPPLGSLPSLEVLKLVELTSVTSIGEEFYGTSDVIFRSLKELAFYKLENWKKWSDLGERQLFPRLQKLKIAECSDLSEAPLQCLSSSVVELHLSFCDEVTNNIGKYLANMTSLHELYLEAWKFANIDLWCNNLSELRVLTLGNIGTLPHPQNELSSLVNLRKIIFPRFHECVDASDVPPLQSMLQGQHMHYLPSLVCIEVFYCYGLPKVLLNLGRIPLLRTLLIDHNYYKLDKFTKDEESWLSGLTSLEEMELSTCHYLEHLPTCLSTLPSLKKFTLKACPKICSLPQEGLPRSLKELYIIECSVELMQGCEPNKGKEWSKISHIPYIRVYKEKKQAEL